MQKLKSAIIYPIVFTSAFTLIACTSSEDKAQEYLTNGQELLDQGKPELAMVQLKNTIKVDPKLAQAHFLQAKIFEKNKDWKGMFAALQRTVALDEQHFDAQLNLGKLYLLSNSLEQAGEQADKVIAMDPESVAANTLKGTYLLKAEQHAEAKAFAQKALTLDAADVDAISLYASLLIPEQGYDEAQAMIATGLEAKPENPVLHLMKIRVHAAQAQLADAIETFEQLIEYYPEQLGYRQSLALFHMRIGEVADAERVLRETVTALPDNLQAKLSLAQFLARENPDAAIAQLETFVGTDSEGSKQLQFALASLQKRQGSIEDASATYQGIIDADIESNDALTARNELARIALNQQDQAEATKLISNVLELDPQNPEALILRAYTRILERKTDEAIADIRVVLRDQPESDIALELLGRAYLQHSAIELATESFQAALQSNPFNLLAAKQLSRMYLQRRQFSEAETLLSRIVNGNRADDEISRLLIQVKLSLKEWPQAEGMAIEYGKQTENPEFAQYVQGVSLQAQQKYPESIDIFKALLANNPDMTTPLTALVRSYMLLEQPQKARAYLQQFIKQHPDNMTARDQLAKEYARNKEWTEAEQTLSTALGHNAKWIGGYQALANVYARQNKLQEAISTYQRALDINPNALAYKLQMAGLHEKLGQKETALTLYQELLDKVPALDVAANNLAMIMITNDDDDINNLDGALELARRFENSEQPYFADTLGWIHYLKGNYPKAIELIERAVNKAPNVADFHYHLGAAHYKNKGLESAKLHLQKSVTLAENSGPFEGIDDANRLLTLL